MARQAAEEFGCITDEWNGYNVLHNAASRMAALEMGFIPAHSFDLADMGLVYLLGVDNPETVNSIHPHSFVIYQGHHGDLGAHRADIILPGAAYTEKDGIYMNTEGRAQRGRRAVFPPGAAREDWKIIRALSDTCETSIGFNDISDLRTDMIARHGRLGMFDQIIHPDWRSFGGAEHQISDIPFENPIKNFYMTNPICHVSETMKRCTSQFVMGEEEYQEAAE